MRHMYQLNKLLFLFFPLFLFSFDNLYKLDSDKIKVVTTKNSYKLLLNQQEFLSYRTSNGFKFFIPYFTKEFNLKVLRYNSIGYINGSLSMNRNFVNPMKNINPSQLRYYMTDYRSYGRELDFLLKNRTIPYNKVTSLSIEAYNIPFSISKQLNRYIYFKRDKLNNNKLKYILYSFYIILDKRAVDKYTRFYFPHSKNLIYTFLHNIGKVKPYIYRKSIYIPKKKIVEKKEKTKIKPKKRVIKKTKKVVEKTKKPEKYKLNFARLFYMKDFGFIYKQPKSDSKIVEIKSYKIVEELKKLSLNLKSKLSKKIIFQPIIIYQDFSDKLDNIKQSVLDLPFAIKSKKCEFSTSKIDKKCFKNPIYFQNYIYYAIKKNKIPKDDVILAYGNYKTFNDIGKYFYDTMRFKKSEIYLNKAYILADNKSIPAHNLAVLYATSGINYYDAKKTVKYLKISKLSIDKYNLGVYYYLGLGVRESDRLARLSFEKAKEIPFAKENLKIMNKYKIGLK